MALKGTLSRIRQLGCCMKSLQRNIATQQYGTATVSSVGGRLEKNEVTQIQSRTFSLFSKSTHHDKYHNSLIVILNQCGELSALSTKSVVISSRQGISTEDGNTSEKANARTDILYEELRDLINEGKTLLVDVREPKEIEETGMMPGAINIPITKLKYSMTMDDQAFLDAYKKQKPGGAGNHLVFYGLSNIKSESALELSHKAGYNKARHYPGGWKEWAEKHSGK